MQYGSMVVQHGGQYARPVPGWGGLPALTLITRNTNLSAPRDNRGQGYEPSSTGFWGKRSSEEASWCQVTAVSNPEASPPSLMTGAPPRENRYHSMVEEERSRLVEKRNHRSTKRSGARPLEEGELTNGFLLQSIISKKRKRQELN